MSLSLPSWIQAQVAKPAEYVSVGDYTGTANEKISAAIAAAQLTDHKTVYFPNGTYALRSGLNLQQGPDTTLHLIGESRNGVFIIPDIPYLEANYNGGDWQNGGARLAHMLNLSRTNAFTVFNTVDVSIQNLTIDMRNQRVMGEAVTYNVVGHGVRIGTGWNSGKFLVNEVTLRNLGSYGVGIQDRDGHPKNNVTLSNIHIERAGSDGIDTKEASGDGNRNLVIRNISINEVGFLDTGAAPGIDLRYRDITIENANIVSKSNQGINAGQSTTGINFRPWDNGPDTGIASATVSNAYIRGTGTGMRIHSNDTAPTPHKNIAISDFKIQGQKAAGIDILGKEHTGHTISNGFVDPAFGKGVVPNGQAVVTNVVRNRWDPALTPTTDTTFEKQASFAGKTFSPAWAGMVGSERVSLNPTSPVAGPFTFDVGNTGVMQIDCDGNFDAMDKLIVDGTLNLDGELKIKLVSGATPAAGTYKIFEADAITGSFDTFSLPNIPGLGWVTDKLAVDGTISLEEVTSLITPVNTGSMVKVGPLGNSSVTMSFDAGANAEKLIVAISTERSNEAGYAVTYGGESLEVAIDAVQAGIYFLDLRSSTYAGGAADLVVDFNGVNTVNGVAIGAVSVFANDYDIELHAVASGTTSAELTTTRDDAFNVASFNANGSGSPSVNSPLNAIYANGSIGSAQGAAGFQTDVAAGVRDYGWNTSDKRRAVAAAFVIANNFANWANDNELGEASGLEDDPDGDRLPNGLEAWFGTDPSEVSVGPRNVATNGTVTTFDHPISDNPPEDLELVYEWSMNLTDWFSGDGVDGPVSGPRVESTLQVEGSMATVTLTASEVMSKLFMRPVAVEVP